jgi:hypothetical protein
MVPILLLHISTTELSYSRLILLVLEEFLLSNRIWYNLGKENGPI